MGGGVSIRQRVIESTCTSNHRIERSRLKPTGNYSIRNCRWMTRAEQGQNPMSLTSSVLTLLCSGGCHF